MLSPALCLYTNVHDVRFTWNRQWSKPSLSSCCRCLDLFLDRAYRSLGVFVGGEFTATTLLPSIDRINSSIIDRSLSGTLDHYTPSPARPFDLSTVSRVGLDLAIKLAEKAYVRTIQRNVTCSRSNVRFQDRIRERVTITSCTNLLPQGRSMVVRPVVEGIKVDR